jgi:hypothetical protein
MKPAAFLVALTILAVAPLSSAAAADNESARIFTLEMAQLVVGSPVVPSDRNSTADIKNGAVIVSQCSYSAQRGEATTSVGLTLRRAATSEEAKSTFLGSKNIYNGQEITALGDMAYRTAAPAQLNVLKGRNWLIISAGVFPRPDPVMQEKAAREILKNLAN